jgi:Family of unknown function (DUF5670)
MWMIVAIILLLWLYGMISDLFGNMIHLLLIVALPALVFYAASNKLSRIGPSLNQPGLESS